MLVAVATVGLIAWSLWPVVRPARTVPVAQAVFDRSAVVAVSAERPARGETVQAAGWLEAEPFYIACTALADGVVETIEALEGERVEQGQIVARLVAEDSELRLRRAEAERVNAAAELSLAEAELLAAQRTWEAPVALNRAVETSVAALAESRAELARLPSLIESARATLVGFEEQFSRAERSRTGGAATELEVILARQRVAAQRAHLESIEAQAPLLAARVARLEAELRAAERDLELRIEDKRRVDAATASLAQAQARLARAEAQRDEAALELERMVIRAPITGYVQRRLKSPGDKAIRMMDSPHSAHVLHLYDPERLQVRVDVPLADASNVFVGQRCEVVVEVLPDRTFAGEVLRITHEADLQKNTLQIKVKVIDPDPILRPEMLTRVKFLPEGARAGRGEAVSDAGGTRVLVPATALDESGASPRVWTVTDRGQGRGVLRPVSVRLIERSDGWISVSGDVQPGSLLALEFDSAHDGERVAVREPSEGGAS